MFPTVWRLSFFSGFIVPVRTAKLRKNGEKKRGKLKNKTDEEFRIDQPPGRKEIPSRSSVQHDSPADTAEHLEVPISKPIVSSPSEKTPLQQRVLGMVKRQEFSTSVRYRLLFSVCYRFQKENSWRTETWLLPELASWLTNWCLKLSKSWPGTNTWGWWVFNAVQYLKIFCHIKALRKKGKTESSWRNHR